MKAVIIIAVLCGMAMANACLKGCYTTVCVDATKNDAAAKKKCDNSLGSLTACGEKNCKSEKNPFQCVESKCLADANAKNFWTCAVSKCKRASKMSTVRSVMTIADVMESYELEHQNDEEEADVASEEQEEVYEPKPFTRPDCRVGCVMMQCNNNDKTCLNELKNYIDCVHSKCFAEKFSKACGESKCKATASQYSFLTCLNRCGPANTIAIKSTLAAIDQGRVIDLTKTTSHPANEEVYKATTVTVTNSAGLLSFAAVIVAFVVAVL